MIIVVSIKLSLDWISSKTLSIFFEFWIIEIFPFLIDILLIKIILAGWNKWSLNSFIIQILPWEICKPWMILHFMSATIPQSILWFSLNHFIYKVRGFDWPSSLNFSFLYLNLLREDVISNFFSRFSNVWSSSIHAFIGHYSNGEVINRGGMILSAHYLWSHVTWCSRCVLRIFGSPYSCNTKICYSNVAIIINYQILRFNVSMNDLFLMAILKTSH